MRPVHQEIPQDDTPPPRDKIVSRIAHCHQSVPFSNSLSRRMYTVRSRDGRPLKQVRLSSCQTKYVPARRRNVTFHSFPVGLRTSFAGAVSRDAGHSSRVSLGASCFSYSNEIRSGWLLMSHPRKVVFAHQCVLFACDKIGGSPGSPWPNACTQLEAKEAEVCNADSSSSSRWA